MSHAFSAPQAPYSPTESPPIKTTKLFLNELKQQSSTALTNRSAFPFITHSVCLETAEQVQDYFDAMIRDNQSISRNPDNFQYDTLIQVNASSPDIEHQLLYDVTINNIKECNIAPPIKLVILTAHITINGYKTSEKMSLILDKNDKVRGFY